MAAAATAATAAATSSPEQFTELTDYIYPPLNDLDFSSPFVKLAVVILAALTSVLLYIITQLVFTLTSSLYRKLCLKERVFWNLAVVRSCFGLFCIVVGLWGFFADTALNQDVVFSTSPTSYLAMGVTTGFFVFECLALTLSDACFRTFSGMLQLHHWISLLGFIIVMVTDTGHPFGCRGLLLEMSTPFSCLCWTLLKAGRERSLLWKANQFLLVHTFHLRNVVELSIWGLTYRHWGHVWAHMPWPLFLTLYLQLTLVTFFMTPFWTLKKTRQMISPVDWNFESAQVVDSNSSKNNNNKSGENAGGNGLVYEVHENGYTHIGNGHTHLLSGYTHVGNGYTCQSGTGIKEE